MADVPALLDYVEAQTDLDVIAVTDHDDITGALKARERCARGRFRFSVVPGVEVTTIEGHVLALFVDRPIQSLRPVEETIAAIHRLGGMAVVPHPFTWLTRGLGLRHIRRVLASQDPAVHFDGIEVTNGTPAGRQGSRRARRLNDSEFHMAEVGGSDAHFLPAIGAGHTEFEGTTPEALREAMDERATRGVSGRHPTLSELGFVQVAQQTYRGIMCTPRAMGWGPTAWSFVRRIVTVR
jgi:predicted metal-dependent phosphoesterase TrpH